MKKITALLFLAALLVSTGFAQPCLIVKHKGTIGRRLIWTALIGVPIAPGAKYDYVDSTGMYRTKMSYGGKELETLQSAGTHVIVLDKSTSDNLKAAHDACMESASAQPAPGAVAPPIPNAQPVPLAQSAAQPAPNNPPAAQESLGDAARRLRKQKQQTPQSQ